MCPEMEDRLNGYVDRTLGVAERAAVEAHLAGCPRCRAALAQLEQLLTAAAALPRSIDPRHDLWGGIARRLGRRPGAAWWRERTFWGGAMAAATTLLLVLGIARLTTGPSRRLAPRDWAAVEQEYAQAAGELSRTLATERHALRPETVALVERNLQIIDAAIRESQAALARDSGNAALEQLVAAAYRQKVELLGWAARLATKD